MLSRFFPGNRVALYRASPLKGRIDLIGQRLIALRYLPVVIAQHVREWLRFAAYLEQHAIALPLHSRAPEVEAYVVRRVHACQSASRVRFVRASLRILLEADEAGRFRRRVGIPPRPVPPWLAPAVDQYAAFLQLHRGAAPRTTARRVWQLTRFAEWLEQSGATSLTAIAPSHIQRFLITLRHQAPATRMTYRTTFRTFLGWAYATELVATDLRPAVTAPRRFKQRGLRDVLAQDEVVHILSSIDRASAVGRRDYAVLILAARYGLRPCDIRALQLDDLHWRAGILTLRQVKTGRPLTLPLLPDVMEALIAYLRDGRPATASRHVFVRHRAPFEPFAPANNLVDIMRRTLQRAGLSQRAGRRGLYVFRHTLASRLLTAGCSMKSIGDVLGHASTETTMEYASIDLAALRQVSLSEQEVCA